MILSQALHRHGSAASSMNRLAPAGDVCEVQQRSSRALPLCAQLQVQQARQGRHGACGHGRSAAAEVLVGDAEEGRSRKLSRARRAELARKHRDGCSQGCFACHLVDPPIHDVEQGLPGCIATGALATAVASCTSAGMAPAGTASAAARAAALCPRSGRMRAGGSAAAGPAGAAQVGRGASSRAPPAARLARCQAGARPAPPGLEKRPQLELAIRAIPRQPQRRWRGARGSRLLAPRRAAVDGLQQSLCRRQLRRPIAGAEALHQGWDVWAGARGEQGNLKMEKACGTG